MVAARRRGQIKGHAACLRKALQKGSDQEADCIRSLQMIENCSCSVSPRSCSQHIGAMGKREQVTPVDQSVLDMALHSNKSWQDLGAYETISKAQAADGEHRGLASAEEVHQVNLVFCGSLLCQNVQLNHGGGGPLQKRQ